MDPAGGDDVFGPRHVRVVKLLEVPPDAGLGGHMEDDVATACRLHHGIEVGEVSAALLDPESCQFGIIST